MPRSTTSRRVRGSQTITDFPETDKETALTTTAIAPAETEDTVRELPFTVQISAAEDGYKPDRSPAGRKRIPSPFEGVLPELKGKGWQNQPHDGKVVPEEGTTDKYNTLTSVKDSNARVILRELQKAVKFLNSEEGGELNLGLDVNVTATDVQFNIRDKQKREKKATAPGGGDVTDGETDDYGSDESNGAE
jgi:hypothetical protein